MLAEVFDQFRQDGTVGAHDRRRVVTEDLVDPLQRGVGRGGETLLAEQRLMRQADELVVLADSSKFKSRSSLILCPLERVSTIITDDGIDDRDRRFIETAGIELIVATVDQKEDAQQSPTVA